jgi:integrase
MAANSPQVNTVGRLRPASRELNHRQLARTAGLHPRSPQCRPRPHDLRHSFAVASLLDAYSARQDGQTRLALLSTYLGHVNPAATYWYLSAAPELLALAGQRLEHHLRERP